MITNVSNTILKTLYPTQDAIYLPYNGYNDYGLQFDSAYCDQSNFVYEYASKLNPPFKTLSPQQYNFFSCLIYNHITEQAIIAKKYSLMFHIPCLLIQHDIADNSIQQKTLSNIVDNNKVACSKIVVPDKIIADSWGIECDVIPYGIPITNHPKTVDCCLVGNLADEDMDLVDLLYDEIPNLEICINKDFNTTMELINKSKVCISPGNHYAPQIFILMAMGAGCVTITNPTIFSLKYIDNAVNGILIDELKESKLYVQDAIDEHSVIGKNAQEYILNNNSMDLHKLLMNKALDNVRKMIWKL